MDEYARPATLEDLKTLIRALNESPTGSFWNRPLLRYNSGRATRSGAAKGVAVTRAAGFVVQIQFMYHKPENALKIQSVVTQTLYAQLADEASAYAVSLFEEGLKGSAYKTHSGGADYWYWQVQQPNGRLKKMSLGRDCEAVRTLVARLNERKQNAQLIDELASTTRRSQGAGR